MNQKIPTENKWLNRHICYRQDALLTQMLGICIVAVPIAVLLMAGSICLKLHNT